ncbi:MAG: diguanylate cyclase [Azonexus sp.]
MTTPGEIPTQEPPPTIQRAKVFLLIGLPILTVFGFIALREANWLLSVLLALNIMTIGVGYIALLRGDNRPATARPGIASFALLVLYLIANAGPEHGRALWFYVFPLVSIIVLPPKEGAIWSGASILIAACIMTTGIVGIVGIETSTYSLDFASRFLITAILIAVGVYWSEMVLRRYQQELLAQQSTVEAESVRLKAEIARRVALEVDLRVQASTDALTGLINRRAFMERFAHELARSQRHGPSPTLLMLDIDHFKKINDIHGHPAGDVVLAHLAQLLRSSVRNVDIIGRIGGEEFAVVLVETNAATAAPVIERLLERLRNTTVTLADATTLKFTASIGSTETLWADTIDTAIQRADEALYTAKKTGRDRHCQR